jgi:hypothetical protein
MSNTLYPGALDPAQYDPQTTDTLASAPHHLQHGFANDAIIALETKLGQGSSVASSSSFLVGIGPNESEWVNTLTSPSITTSLEDVNAKTWVGQTAALNAVNYINIGNSATGNAPTISVLGSDNNISLNLIPKGSGKVQDNGTNLVDFRNSFADFVSSGCVWTPGSGLVGSMTAGVIFINGVEYSLASVGNHTFGASVDTYVDYTVGTGITYTAVANNAASPALAANSIRLAIVVSGASLSSVNQGQTNAVAPVASSVIYSVCDSLGNLIYPCDPVGKTVGYRYLSSTFTATATSYASVTGLTIPVLAPGNRNLKVTVDMNYCAIANATAGAGIYFDVYDVGASTEVAATTISSPSLSSACNGNFQGTIPMPTAGLHTYQVRYYGQYANNVSAVVPVYAEVELN